LNELILTVHIGIRWRVADESVLPEALLLSADIGPIFFEKVQLYFELPDLLIQGSDERFLVLRSLRSYLGKDLWQFIQYLFLPLCYSLHFIDNERVKMTSKACGKSGGHLNQVERL
jgi:hypothetical protein